MQGVWGKAADQGDRSEGEGLKKKEARRFVEPGHRQTCDHTNEVGFFFVCVVFSFSENSGELWSIFNQGVSWLDMCLGR